MRRPARLAFEFENLFTVLQSAITKKGGDLRAKPILWLNVLDRSRQQNIANLLLQAMPAQFCPIPQTVTDSIIKIANQKLCHDQLIS